MFSCTCLDSVPLVVVCFGEELRRPFGEAGKKGQFVAGEDLVRAAMRPVGGLASGVGPGAAAAVRHIWIDRC